MPAPRGERRWLSNKGSWEEVGFPKKLSKRLLFFATRSRAIRQQQLLTVFASHLESPSSSPISHVELAGIFTSKRALPRGEEANIATIAFGEMLLIGEVGPKCQGSRLVTLTLETVFCEKQQAATNWLSIDFAITHSSSIFTFAFLLVKSHHVHSTLSFRREGESLKQSQNAHTDWTTAVLHRNTHKMIDHRRQSKQTFACGGNAWMPDNKITVKQAL